MHLRRPRTKGLWSSAHRYATIMPLLKKPPLSQSNSGFAEDASACPIFFGTYITK